MTGQKPPATSRRGARIGRPPGQGGPKRVALTVRILESTDARLTAAIQATGDNPQAIVEKALNRYFDHLNAEAGPS